jgi:AcrR family transcriptional regulator
MDAKTLKSELTQKAIIDAALELALEKGLFSITLQAVADKLQLSKSGIFSRVGSKESLRNAVIQEYSQRFMDDVFMPSLKRPRGVERLSCIFELWAESIISAKSMGSSLFEATAFSFEMDTQADLKKQLTDGVAAWRSVLHKCVQHCLEAQQFPQDMDIDVFLLDLHNLVLGLLYETHFMEDDRSRMRVRKSYRLLLERHLIAPYQHLSG